jgi:hypothetical protein
MEIKEYAFRVANHLIFTVKSGDGNKDLVDKHGKVLYFATTAGVLNRPRTDYNEVGQCQKKVLPNPSPAFDFFERYDKYQIKDLIDIPSDELENILSDIETLKKVYPYIEGHSFFDIVRMDRTATAEEREKGKRK